MAILAWFVGKLSAWTDEYPWTPDELIHWSLIHYQGSPSAAMQIYKEASAVLNASPDSMLGQYICQPVGAYVFPKEVSRSPSCRSMYWVTDMMVYSCGLHHETGWRKRATSNSGDITDVVVILLPGNVPRRWWTT